ISSQGVHWERWLVPILSLTALLAAASLTEGIEVAASAIAPLRGRAGALAIGLIMAALLVGPGIDQVRAGRIRALPSTEIESMRWIEQHAPPNARIGQEWYTAPLRPSKFRLTVRFSLAEEPLDFYRRIPVEMVMVSSNIYGRYLSQPARYPREV